MGVDCGIVVYTISSLLVFQTFRLLSVLLFLPALYPFISFLEACLGPLFLCMLQASPSAFYVMNYECNGRFTFFDVFLGFKTFYRVPTTTSLRKTFLAFHTSTSFSESWLVYDVL